MRIVILAVVIAMVLPVYGQGKSPKANAKGEKTENIVQRPPTPSLATVNQQTADQNEGRSHDHPDSYFKRLFSPENLPNIGLLIAGVIGIFVAICTLKIIERQTVATERAVTTTTRQFAAENRPYVLLPSGDEKARIDEPYLFPLTSVPHSQQKRTHCMFTLRNYGKTPAKIIAEKFQLQIGGSAFVVPDLGVFEMKDATQDNFILAQTDSIQAEAELFPNKFITPEQKAEIDSKASFVWLCGFLRYRDTLGVEETTEYKPPEYETRFCLLWETTTNAPKPFWRLAGPKKYNNAT